MTFILNCITSITNITAYFPYRLAIEAGDILTGSLVIFAATSSAISHLFETHKHDMHGFGMPKKYSYWMNRIDILGVVLLVSRCLYIAYKNGNILYFLFNNPFWVLSFLTTIMIGRLSETDPGYSYYVATHSIWHLSIFLILEWFLKIQYNNII